MAENNQGDKGKQTGKEEAAEAKKPTRKSAYVMPEQGEQAAEATDKAQSEGGVGAEAEPGEATPEATPLDSILGDSLRQALRKYVIEKVVPPGTKAGDVEINLDVDFLRKHGKDLVGALVQSVADAIIPDKVEVNLPLVGARGGKAAAEEEAAAKPPEAAEAAEAEGEESDVKVSVNFDFVNFFRGLLATPIPGVTTAPEEEEEAEEAEAAVEESEESSASEESGEGNGEDKKES